MLLKICLLNIIPNQLIKNLNEKEKLNHDLDFIEKLKKGFNYPIYKKIILFLLFYLCFNKIIFFIKIKKIN